MPRDSEALKILRGVWASGPNADRTDPDDSGLNPTLNREIGWPASFSDGTNLPRREVFNQRFRELDGAARDAMVFGIPPWSADVDYPANEGLVQRQVAGRVQVFTNNANTGPGSTVVDPATDGQTTWEPIGGLNVQVQGVVALAGERAGDRPVGAARPAGPHGLPRPVEVGRPVLLGRPPAGRDGRRHPHGHDHGPFQRDRVRLPGGRASWAGSSRNTARR